MSSRGNNDFPEPSSPLAKKGKKGTMKGKKPKYVIKLPLQKAPAIESPIVQPNPFEAENVVPNPSQPSVVEPTHSQPSIVQPRASQPPDNASPISMPSRVLEIIEPCNDEFYPRRVASKAITKTIKQWYVQPWLSWGEMSDEEKYVFFQRFKDFVKDGEGYEHLLLDEYPMEEFQTIFSQERSEAASCGGGEDTSALDPIEEEKLRNKSWLVAAGGKNPKGRVYGVGKLNEGSLCKKTFTQQASTSTAADSQKILRLEEEIHQSREEFRQSREENQRLQRKLESLVNVVLPLLPPTAQMILQGMNEQPQNEDQNQDHAEEGDQHHGHSSSPHYEDY
ncbi:hypothetical protein Fmac_005771 [Flemingia macrophylla]|uniref:Transposase, Ptta/En/Spm, plant n=1 Tax=Flemingia macrophylla TaxID=520843 RepID=A0ABD1N8R5_9FABA